MSILLSMALFLAAGVDPGVPPVMKPPADNTTAPLVALPPPAPEPAAPVEPLEPEVPAVHAPAASPAKPPHVDVDPDKDRTKAAILSALGSGAALKATGCGLSLLGLPLAFCPPVSVALQLLSPFLVGAAATAGAWAVASQFFGRRVPLVPLLGVATLLMVAGSVVQTVVMTGAFVAWYLGISLAAGFFGVSLSSGSSFIPSRSPLVLAFQGVFFGGYFAVLLSALVLDMLTTVLVASGLGTATWFLGRTVGSREDATHLDLLNTRDEAPTPGGPVEPEERDEDAWDLPTEDL